MSEKKPNLPGPGYTLIYTLVYPAFLGAFIVAMVAKPPVFSFELSASPPWALFFAAYFALQHVEASRKGELKFWQFLVDLFEIVGMVILFSQLGYFEVEIWSWLASDYAATATMFVLLCLPTVTRFLTGKHELILTGLSVLAIIFIVSARLSNFPENAGFWIAGTILVLYAIGWVFTDGGRELCRKTNLKIT